MIFGPPGTGKTKTLVASVLELHRDSPSARILITAPSDAAADVIAKRLVQHYSPNELFRLNWWQRTSASLPNELILYSYLTATGDFDLPSPEQLQNFKIIISTCGTSGCIKDHVAPFDVVIVDEASQVFESEVLIPLTMASAEGISVIAGDTEQLSDNLRTPLFQIYDSYHSLQERLLQSPFYEDIKDQHCEEHHHFVFGSFLCRNYRSHPDIFAVSSNLFYKNALLAAGDAQLINSLLEWTPPQRYQKMLKSLSLPLENEGNEGHIKGGNNNSQLHNNVNTETLDVDLKGDEELSPIHFIGVNGIHKHELDSPSFYNESEISTVVELCRDLTSSSTVSVEERDIGVIAAYRSQVLKLRVDLRKIGLRNVNVGNVFDFQGQEVKVVIISTVLTSGKRITYEEGANKERSGLFGDHRRFNVAVTRGMALCVVVGDPYFLYSDSSWRAYIEACDAKSRYVGNDCKFLARHVKEKDDEDADDLLNAAVQLSLRQSLGNGVASRMHALTLEEQYYADDLTWRTFL